MIISVDGEGDGIRRPLHFVHVKIGIRSTQLRNARSSLTPKDHQLCAYLRMNLTTKEIAPLMNISVRGVEISRYRLRKKLDLDTNENLTEYISQVLGLRF